MVPDSAATASAMFTGVKVIIVNYPKVIILISTLKRLFHQLKICLKAYTIKSVLSVHRQRFFFILACLVQEKINMKFLLAALKHILIQKIVLKAAYKSFCSCLHLLSIVDFFQCTFISSF